MVQDLGKKICTEDISVLFEHNYGRFRAFQMALWFNDNLFKAEFAKELVNYASRKENTSESENLIQIANGSMTSSSYESFFDSPWANSAQVEIEHWKLYQVKSKCKDISFLKTCLVKFWKFENLSFCSSDNTGNITAGKVLNLRNNTFGNPLIQKFLQN